MLMADVMRRKELHRNLLSGRLFCRRMYFISNIHAHSNQDVQIHSLPGQEHTSYIFDIIYDGVLSDVITPCPFYDMVK